MSKRASFLRVSLVLAGLVAGTCAARAEPVAADTPCRAAKLIARDLPRAHLSHRPCDDRVAAAALDNFLNALDFEHSYFLASDVAAFQKDATNLDDWLAAGNMEFAERVYGTLKARVENRLAYVDLLLTNGFDLATKEAYHWDRKEAPWPADEKEWDELWRQKVKNQYVGAVVARKMAEEDKLSRTNAPAGDEADAGTETNETADLKLTPEESIRKGYKQFLTMLNDNQAEWILDRYLTAFAQAYDPHSDYLSKENTEDFDIGMKLSLVGIGALLSSDEGAAKVERVIPGGPADKDGRLKAGDKIIAVAQGEDPAVSIMHWPLTKAVRVIRGEKNTKVVLSIIPAADQSGSTVTKIDLIRDEVKLEDQAAKGEVREIADPKGEPRRIGVITLPEFYADIKGRRENGKEPRSSTRDVERVLRELQTNAVDGVVLDLRNNGGGLLAEAIDMTGLFINSGPVVQVSDGRGVQVLGDDDPDVTYKGPLVILVNRQTASASEILAGALQDYGRAVIVGDSKTHGKGTVQSMASLAGKDPSAGTLKATSASFYRIDGGSTQMKGISPDIVVPSVLDSMEVGEEYLPHAMPWTFTDSALYRQSPTIQRLLPDLRKMSEKRRAADPKFAAYEGMLERLAKRQKSKEISLNLDERLALARDEKELQKQLDADAPKTDKKDAKNQDLILNEALRICSDLATLAHWPRTVLTVTEPK